MWSPPYFVVTILLEESLVACGAWDLNKVRTAKAFTLAFVAVKAKEVVTQLKQCRVCQCLGSDKFQFQGTFPEPNVVIGHLVRGNHCLVTKTVVFS